MADRALGNPLGNPLGLVRRENATHASQPTPLIINSDKQFPRTEYIPADLGLVLPQADYPKLFASVGLTELSIDTPLSVNKTIPEVPNTVSGTFGAGSKTGAWVISGIGFGNTYRSTNDGDSWSAMQGLGPITNIATDNNGTWWAVRSQSIVIRSTDDGVSWTDVYTLPATANTLTCTSSTVYVSTNTPVFGLHTLDIASGVWRDAASNLPARTSGVTTICASENGVVLIGSSNFTPHISRDNGLTWNVIDITGTTYNGLRNALTNSSGTWVVHASSGSASNSFFVWRLSVDDCKTWISIGTAAGSGYGDAMMLYRGDLISLSSQSTNSRYFWQNVVDSSLRSLKTSNDGVTYAFIPGPDGKYFRSTGTTASATLMFRVPNTSKYDRNTSFKLPNLPYFAGKRPYYRNIDGE